MADSVVADRPERPLSPTYEARFAQMFPRLEEDEIIGRTDGKHLKKRCDARRHPDR